MELEFLNSKYKGNKIASSITCILTQKGHQNFHVYNAYPDVNMPLLLCITFHWIL